MKSFSILSTFNLLAILLIATIPFNLQCKKDCDEMKDVIIVDTLMDETCYPDLKQKSTINGVSFVGSNVVLQESHVKPIERINTNWVAFMPFAFIRSGSNTLEFNTSRQWRGERVEGIVESIEIARKLNQKICLKLHVWSHVIPYTGDFELSTEQEWKEFEKSFTNYCLLYADLAEQYKLDLFCIGVEWKKFIINRPEYWHQLIKDVREVYKGDITYAANWDEYKTVPFWKELDYIGVDGYFPLSPSAVPDSCEIKDFWTTHIDEMASVAKREERQIIFTEYGYRSMQFATKAPWDWNINNEVSMDVQSNAYIALFNSVWQQDWYHGGFFWKWYHNDINAGGQSNNKFTPQNKPVEKVINHYYRLYQ